MATPAIGAPSRGTVHSGGQSVDVIPPDLQETFPAAVWHAEMIEVLKQVYAMTRNQIPAGRQYRSPANDTSVITVP
jgi:hypothetical protein